MGGRSVSSRQKITVYLIECHPLAEERLRVILRRSRRFEILSREQGVRDQPDSGNEAESSPAT